MHGDEVLGPHTLLYAYQHLKAYKIVYFPMANPSGFIKNTRYTFPNKVDLNRDFPVDRNILCYRATATHIIDYLFRKYTFDLTVALHNGCSSNSCSEIGFNWGTVTHKGNSHTAEYGILHDIG
jgi:predicted deacylase